MGGEAARWLEFARQDLRMADLALGDGLWSQACFHAQQCAEKTLKASLEQRGRVPPRTHKLADLVYLLGAALPAAIGNDLIKLDRFYLPTRYPDAIPGTLADGLPGQKEAEEAVAMARKLLAVLEP